MMKYKGCRTLFLSVKPREVIMSVYNFTSKVKTSVTEPSSMKFEIVTYSPRASLSLNS